MPDQTSCLAPHDGRVHSQISERTNTSGKQVSNKILLSISDSDYSLLRPHLEYVSLPNHLVLHEVGGKLEFAYFLNRGVWKAGVCVFPESRFDFSCGRNERWKNRRGWHSWK